MLSVNSVREIKRNPYRIDASELLETCEIYLLAAGACTIGENLARSSFVLLPDDPIGMKVIQWASRAIYGRLDERFVQNTRDDPRWFRISERLPEAAIATLIKRLSELL